MKNVEGYSKKVRTPGEKTGLGPGALVFVGKPRPEAVRVDVIHYDEGRLVELYDVSAEECANLVAQKGVTWINVTGIHDVELIGKLGKCLGLHPLTTEDVVNTAQRPKVEEFPDYIFIVLKMIYLGQRTDETDTEHLSLILGSNFVVLFQEKEGDVFDGVRERIRSAKGRIRSMGADYLAYALIDSVVDHYFLFVEHFGDVIEDLDDRIIEDPKPEDLALLHKIKQNIIKIRKVVWPLREEIRVLEKGESPLIRSDTRVFLRDVSDHIMQIVEMIETFRDLISGLHDLYLSNVSNRMNEIMKVLTLIATVFMPITFIAGIYGMNFEYMPELKWRWGYFAVLAVMLLVVLAMIGFFRKKKWL
ncbi:magnesium/cobalt transporter CorA [Thermodesulforhabdus norvegica]|uniref:Magnesium transport protein CorA n=1 Tax=Thermodesulforhabdus norvegica TaxID=39841 RepID=A0A1I4UIZ1_9BACT|nr:magnesium/cobalt transporter CorA [Thermodesulforhabdus norvegica]SFM88928.1 magnesium transporter [Thermodesulforhabdus norvegica]